MENESFYKAIISRLRELDDLYVCDAITNFEYSAQCAKLNECLYQLSLKKEKEGENEGK